jgi:hypothetical protein
MWSVVSRLMSSTNVGEGGFKRKERPSRIGMSPMERRGHHHYEVLLLFHGMKRPSISVRSVCVLRVDPNRCNYPSSQNNPIPNERPQWRTMKRGIRTYHGNWRKLIKEWHGASTVIRAGGNIFGWTRNCWSTFRLFIHSFALSHPCPLFITLCCIWVLVLMNYLFFRSLVVKLKWVDPSCAVLRHRVCWLMSFRTSQTCHIPNFC